jgi:hypothetical protein
MENLSFLADRAAYLGKAIGLSIFNIFLLALTASLSFTPGGYPASALSFLYCLSYSL